MPVFYESNVFGELEMSLDDYELSLKASCNGNAEWRN